MYASIEHIWIYAITKARLKDAFRGSHQRLRVDYVATRAEGEGVRRVTLTLCSHHASPNEVLL
jgi:hypothetical protein